MDFSKPVPTRPGSSRSIHRIVESVILPQQRETIPLLPLVPVEPFHKELAARWFKIGCPESAEYDPKQIEHVPGFARYVQKQIYGK